jgi:SET domain-containing protein
MFLVVICHSMGAKLRVNATPEKGIGVFAEEVLSRGRKIIEFTGPLIREDLIPYPLLPEEDCFLQVDEDMYSVTSTNMLHQANHSCDPNCAVLINPKPTLFALRDIRKGEELSYDYSVTSTKSEALWQMVCRCGSSQCRKLISGFHTIPREKQEVYVRLGVVPDYVLQHYVRLWVHNI